jgi:hypothetical protein
VRCAARGIGLLAVTAMFAAFTGSANALADDALTGKTYADATEKIAGWNLKPVIASVVGSALPRDECIVTNWRKSGHLDDHGRSHHDTVLVSLNCNNRVAAPGLPGNSVATPEGKEEQRIQERADFINNHPEYCQRNPDSCEQFCTRYPGRCTTEPGE